MKERTLDAMFFLRNGMGIELETEDKGSFIVIFS